MVDLTGLVVGVLSRSRFTMQIVSGILVKGDFPRLAATIGWCPLHCVNLITALRGTRQALLERWGTSNTYNHCYALWYQIMERIFVNCLSLTWIGMRSTRCSSMVGLAFIFALYLRVSQAFVTLGSNSLFNLHVCSNLMNLTYIYIYIYICDDFTLHKVMS